MSLINGMFQDITGGTMLKYHRTFYTYETNTTNNICIEITGKTDEDYFGDTYIIPFVSTNENFDIDIYDESICLVLETGITMSAWTINYLNLLVTTGYSGYDNSSFEERIIYDQINDHYYKLDHKLNYTGVYETSIDTSEKWAIINFDDNTIWISGDTGHTNFYYNELDNCGISTGRELVMLRDINQFSVSNNAVKYIERCTTLLLVPIVIMNENVSGITYNSAYVTGEITSQGSSNVIEKGFCYSVFTSPTIDEYKINKGSGIGSFNSAITGLTKKTLYYIRPYAINSSGVGYGNEVSFKTSIAPTIQTTSISNTTQFTSEVNGLILDDGGEDIINIGACYSTGATPTINDYKIQTNEINDNFMIILTGLTSGTTYYTRSYAINKRGVGYGNILSLNTLNVSVPAITLYDAYDITYSGTSLNSSIIYNGGLPVTERGICYNLVSNPQIGINGATTIIGTGDLYNLINLSENTTYYARAYAKNAMGIGYSNEITFNTKIKPNVTINWTLDTGYRDGYFEIMINDEPIDEVMDGSYQYGTIYAYGGDVMSCRIYSNQGVSLTVSSPGISDTYNNVYSIISNDYTLIGNQDYNVQGQFINNYI